MTTTLTDNSDENSLVQREEMPHCHGTETWRQRGIVFLFHYRFAPPNGVVMKTMIFHPARIKQVAAIDDQRIT